ncbi:alcohol dehydrogenase YqhD (iron-dependent ADH family) [Oceanotoga teriensis]|jgi:alcohol dehydrogenase YqhD (iron-dependent ADH family)|uniref:Alcohol dehydrogenase YqhD (Iron-dependent ADH family) n=1 Tax=Oceanotoga teriensis TaxID=515440 RepID=A0AA45C7D0_9BACT|nr:iron-containing alcohol dehydrogenase [Oceanotoga teriensis]PWJ95326.1 alcohol dehydrogenase YqhD (iron-dependent ADH family) [Oceanotoga teriensis]
MNFDFTYENPTTIHFGKNAMNNLEIELSKYGDNILLAYGRNSIKKIGLYDQIITICKKLNKNVYELSGIMPNPTYEKVQEGSKLVVENKVDLILAVGGGSVIDCAKAISVSAYCEGDAWTKYWLQFEPVNNKIVPVGSVLTMVGTGSEMNGGSVITNEQMKLKIGRVYPFNVNPKFSILNPEYTYSVSKYQMVSGIFDMMSHLMEAYFAGNDDSVSNYIIEGILRSVIVNARKAVENQEDYEARSNLMWSASLAMNPIVGLSKAQDWEVHMIEHQLGAYTDCAHGMGLAAISLPYYRYIYKYGLDKFVRFAKVVWGIEEKDKTKEEIALAGIDELERFTKECGIITSLKDLGATQEMLPLIAESTIVLNGGYKELTKEEILNILKEAY